MPPELTARAQAFRCKAYSTRANRLPPCPFCRVGQRRAKLRRIRLMDRLRRERIGRHRHARDPLGACIALGRGGKLSDRFGCLHADGGFCLSGPLAQPCVGPERSPACELANPFDQQVVRQGDVDVSTTVSTGNLQMEVREAVSPADLCVAAHDCLLCRTSRHAAERGVSGASPLLVCINTSLSHLETIESVSLDHIGLLVKRGARAQLAPRTLELAAPIPCGGFSRDRL